MIPRSSVEAVDFDAQAGEWRARLACGHDVPIFRIVGESEADYAERAYRAINRRRACAECARARVSRSRP